MMVISWLKVSIIGLPLSGAFAVWLIGEKYLRIQQWLPPLIFSAISAIAVVLFSSRYYGCTLTYGRENCIYEGLVTLFLAFFSGSLAGVSLAWRDSRYSDRTCSYVLMLLLISAVAGIGLADNLLVLLLALNLLFFVGYRWLRLHGLTWRILTIGDDYKIEE